MKTDSSKRVPFWRTKKLNEMSDEEWELLCDGCAQCCRIKFCDDDSGEISVTPVVCGLLDIPTCRCTHYESRLKLVESCIKVTPDNISDLTWLPETCAYRLVAEERDLYDWHPLIAGDRRKMDELGISVKEQVVSERDVHPEDLEFQAVRWVDN